MCQHIKDLEAQFFRLTYRDFRHLAFQMAEKNGIDHNFNKDTELTGMDWLYGFLRRHLELSLRLPEPTSVARAMGFNRETGITTLPKKKSKILSLKGKKQVGLVSSAERDQLTTAGLCVSAAGAYVPPLLIFPRVRMKAELLDGAPPGTIAICHPSGWIQSDIFVHWSNHFIANVKPTKNDPVLLLLDGHATHTKNLPLIDKVRENGVFIVSFPPHCTHRLQPLDVSVMGPLSTYYSQEVMTRLRNNPGRIVTTFHLGKLFGIAYSKAATLHNAMIGFSKTGICPLNPNIFSDHDFVSAITTDNDVTSTEPTTNSSPETRDNNIVNSTKEKDNPVLAVQLQSAQASPINPQPITPKQIAISPQPSMFCKLRRL
ncbi:hypothetical protein KPH14_011869 [Odynerus spinipes]|uniref:DDE-1 domain-containing protein n=1 Tax=Odynerus spinipes TaxID=1348599 RepID=A0AAD9VKK5_9HYME|nr:hypothetical protein KPH14_011869 [Odynerus spinipes]